MGKFSKYKLQFCEEWKTDPLFKDWIDSVNDDKLKAFCKYCQVVISAHYAGLMSHAGCAKHCKNAAKSENKAELQNGNKNAVELSKHANGSKNMASAQGLLPPEIDIEPPEDVFMSPDDVCTLELTVDDVSHGAEISGQLMKDFRNTNSQSSKLKSGSHLISVGKQIRKLVKSPKAAPSKFADWDRISQMENENIILQDHLVCVEVDQSGTTGDRNIEGQDAHDCAIITNDKSLQLEPDVLDSLVQLDSRKSCNSDVANAVLCKNVRKRQKVSASPEEQVMMSLPVGFSQPMGNYAEVESDMAFKEWIVPVDGDGFKARCICCNILVRANEKSLVEHSQTLIHKTNAEMLFQLRGSDNSPPCSASPKTSRKKDIMISKVKAPDIVCKQEVGENAAENGICPVTTEFADLESSRSAPVDDFHTSIVDPGYESTQNRAGARFGSNAKKRKEAEDDDSAQSRRYAQKYVMRWNNDPVLRDWVAPVPGNIYRAFCRWCQVKLRAHYKSLKLHAESTKHANSAALRGVMSQDYGTEEKIGVEEEEDLESELLNKLEMSGENLEQKSKQNPCYFLSRSSWDRYKQKYRKAWELDPNFRGWIAPVEGDLFKARCLYCRVLIRAHHKDLKEHSKTTKHANNIAFGLPYNVSQAGDAGSVLARPKTLKRKTIARPRRKIGTSSTCESILANDDSLLRPDDTLTSVEALINFATMSCNPEPESAVTTLVFPNATKLDESVAAALPNNPRSLYRVKKMSSSALGPAAKKGKVLDEAEAQEQTSRLVRKVTLWEFLKMKVERSNGSLRIPEMLSEFEGLYEQIRRVVDERLESVDLTNGSTSSIPNPDSVMVLSSDRLAKLLGISVGHYRMKDSPPVFGDAASFSMTKRPGKDNSISTIASTISSVENCIPANNLPLTIFPVDHVTHPDSVLADTQLVFSSASENIITLQDSDYLTLSANNESLVYANTDGTLKIIQVTGPLSTSADST